MATYSKNGHRIGRPPAPYNSVKRAHDRLLRTMSLYAFDHFCDRQRVRILQEMHDPSAYFSGNRYPALAREDGEAEHITGEGEEVLKALHRSMRLGPELKPVEKFTNGALHVEVRK